MINAQETNRFSSNSSLGVGKSRQFQIFDVDIYQFGHFIKSYLVFVLKDQGYGILLGTI